MQHKTAVLIFFIFEGKAFEIILQGYFILSITQVNNFKALRTNAGHIVKLQANVMMVKVVLMVMMTVIMGVVIT